MRHHPTVRRAVLGPGIALALSAWLAGPAGNVDPHRPLGPAGPRHAWSADAQTAPSITYLPWVGRAAGATARVTAGGLGATNVLLADGERVYAGVDDRLAVFNVYNPNAPQLVAASAPLGSPIHAVARAGGAVYAGTTGGGVHAFDVAATDPQRARPLEPGGVLVLDGPVWGLATAGDDWLYAAYTGSEHSAAGLAIIDVSAPLRPRRVGVIDDTDAGYGLAIDGDRGYLAHGLTKLRALDVSDPADPGVAGWFGEMYPEHASGPLGVALHAGFGYVAGVESPLAVFDLGSADREGRLVRTVDRGAAGGAGVAVSVTRLYAADAAAVAVFDLVEPADPQRIGTIAVPGGSRAVATGHDRLYAGGHATQLAVFDLDASGDAAARGAYAAPRRAVRAVAAAGGAMAAISEPPIGLDAYWPDAPDLATPAGRLALVGRAEDIDVRAHRSKPFVYLLSYNAFEAVDLTAPGKPEKRRTLAAPDAKAMAIYGDNAYLAGDGLRVYDLASPDDPRQLAYLPRGGVAEAVAADLTQVYVAQRQVVGARTTDLLVYSVSVRSDPRLIGTLPDIKSTAALASAGGFVYQLYQYDRSYGIKVYDARDPLRPTPVGDGFAYATDGYARAVLREGTRLYLVEEAYFDRVARRDRGRHGVHVLDITEPGRPSLVQLVPFAEPIGGIDVVDGDLYVATGGAGLVRIRLED